MLRKFQFGLIVALIAGAAALAQPAMPPDPATDPEWQGQSSQPGRLADERAGTLPFREGGVLRIVTDRGNIRIITQGAPAGSVSYRLRIETDATSADAAQLLKAFSLSARSFAGGVVLTGSVPWKQFRGRLWVLLEITAPRNMNLDISTAAGNIISDDVDGRAVLVSAGGEVFWVCGSGAAGAAVLSGELQRMAVVV